MLSRLFCRSPRPEDVEAWTELGSRVWRDRVATYGTKPLPDHLDIDEEDIGEDVLDRASNELAIRYIPVRFSTASQREEKRHEMDRKLGFRKTPEHVLDLYRWPRVHCHFVEAPSTQQILEGVRGIEGDGIPLTSMSKLVRIVITAWSVYIGRAPFKNCKGAVQTQDPYIEYEVRIWNNDSDDDAIMTGGRRAVTARLTHEGNDDPPLRLFIPHGSTFGKDDPSARVFTDSPYVSVCVRLYDGDGRLLCVDAGRPRDLFEYRFSSRTEYPAGVQFLQAWACRDAVSMTRKKN